MNTNILSNVLKNQLQTQLKIFMGFIRKNPELCDYEYTTLEFLSDVTLFINDKLLNDEQLKIYNVMADNIDILTNSNHKNSKPLSLIKSLYNYKKSLAPFDDNLNENDYINDYIQLIKQQQIQVVKQLHENHLKIIGILNQYSEKQSSEKSVLNHTLKSDANDDKLFSIEDDLNLKSLFENEPNDVIQKPDNDFYLDTIRNQMLKNVQQKVVNSEVIDENTIKNSKNNNFKNLDNLELQSEIYNYTQNHALINQRSLRKHLVNHHQLNPDYNVQQIMHHLIKRKLINSTPHKGGYYLSINCFNQKIKLNANQKAQLMNFMNQHQYLTKADLHNLTQCSKSKMNTIIGELMTNGFIKPAQKGGIYPISLN